MSANPNRVSRRHVLALAALPLVGLLRPLTAPGFPPLYGDGIHDDTAALQARIDACVATSTPFILNGGTYKVTSIQYGGLDGRSRITGGTYLGTPGPGRATIERAYRADGDYAWFTANLVRG